MAARRQTALQNVAAESAALWKDVEPPARRDMLLAALDLFARHGYHATTTRQIGQEAKLSGAAVYTHFATKAEILQMIGVTGHESILRDVEDTIAHAPDAREALTRYVTAFVTWVAVHHTVARVLAVELRALPAEGFAEVRALRRSLEAHLVRILRSGMASGEFHIDDLDTTSMALLSLPMDITRWYQLRPTPPAPLAERYAQLALRIVGAESQ